MKDQIIKWIVPFVIRQIAKFGEGIDVEKVKADFDERIRKLIPGDLLDDAAILVFDKSFEAIVELFKDSNELKKLVDLCLEKKYMEAMSELGAYLLKTL